MGRSLEVEWCECIVISTGGALSSQRLGIGGINVGVIIDVWPKKKASSLANRV